MSGTKKLQALPTNSQERVRAQQATLREEVAMYSWCKVCNFDGRGCGGPDTSSVFVACASTQD